MSDVTRICRNQRRRPEGREQLLPSCTTNYGSWRPPKWPRETWADLQATALVHEAYIRWLPIRRARLLMRQVSRSTG